MPETLQYPYTLALSQRTCGILMNCNVLRARVHLTTICLCFKFKLCGRPCSAPIYFIKDNHISKGVLGVIFNVSSHHDSFYFLHIQKALKMLKKVPTKGASSCCCPRYCKGTTQSSAETATNVKITRQKCISGDSHTALLNPAGLVSVSQHIV